MFKKFLSIFSVLFLTFCLTIPVNAKQINISKTPRKQIVCGSSPSGDHLLYARGYGILNQKQNDGNIVNIFKGGYTYQCKYCTTVVVSEYDAVNYKLGRYGMYTPGYVVSAYGTVLTTDNIYYQNNRYIPGFDFRLS